MKRLIHSIANRLPLAQAVVKTLHSVCSHSLLEDIWEEHRGQCYTRKIAFPLLFDLVSEALLQPQSSGHRRFQQAIEEETLNTTISAPYKKIAGIPLAVSEALITATGECLQQAMPPTDSPLPDELAHLNVINIDGKKIKHIHKRLKVTRGLVGEVYGAKLLVAHRVASNTVIAMNAHADGERSDAPLLPGLLEQIRDQAKGPRLFVADRQLGDTTSPTLMKDKGDFFLVRRNMKTSFHPDPDTEPIVGTTDDGMTYVDQSGFLGAESNENRMWVRQIHLKRPGDADDVVVVTNLLDADQYPAESVLETYRLRWRIETLFQVVTEVFDLKPLIGSQPKATAFQAALCFFLYNLVKLIQAHIAHAQSRSLDSISIRNLSVDLREEWSAWCCLMSVDESENWLGPALSGFELGEALSELLRDCWTNWWVKRVSGREPSQSGPKRAIAGHHTSVDRLLRGQVKEDSEFSSLTKTTQENQEQQKTKASV